jgi:hypothetical protein
MQSDIMLHHGHFMFVNKFNFYLFTSTFLGGPRIHLQQKRETADKPV